MREMTLEEIKQVELEILEEVSNFCEKNNLKYFLTFGTLIGAIRHKGFIPWDDDVDICMPREDYNKIIETFNKSASDRFELISPEDPRSCHTFVKVIDKRTIKIEPSLDYKNGYLGVDIDIFPLDGQPDGVEEFKKWFTKLNNYYKMHPYMVMEKGKKIKRKIGIPIIKILCGGKKGILKRTNKLHKKYPYEKSSFVGVKESCYESMKNRFLKEWFKDFVLVDFEGKKFRAPIEYDKFLTKTYGDYMKFPPEEQRVTHHINKNYWKDE